MSRRPALVGADDYDDGFDDDYDDYDDDYDDDAYDEYDDHPQQRRGAATSAGRGGRGAPASAAGRGAGRGGATAGRAPAPVTAVRPKPAAPAAAAGASALAQALCDPPPRRSDGSLQPGAAAKPPAALHGGMPLAPGARQPAAFSRPSPDDAAIAAGPKPRVPPAGIQLAPSRTPTVSSLPRRGNAAAAEEDEGAGGIDASMAKLAVSGGSGGGGGGRGSAQPAARRRPASDYRPDPSLARAVAAADAAEGAAGKDGGGSASKRTPLHLAVLGHVDAGKSTLMGRLLHDLGRTSARDAHRHARDAAAAGKASFAWAWALDERPEERARGVTTDVALARFDTPRHRVTLLDAPGHRDFVPEMIGGAAQADAALLLVDASPGAFEAGFGGGGFGGGGGAAAAGASSSSSSPAPPLASGGGQTREHAQLARGMGVEQLAVVVTKLDAWEAAGGGGGAGGAATAAGGSRASAQERFEAIKAAVAPFLRSCGFRDAAVQWLPAVGPTGENLVKSPHEADRDGALGWWRRGGKGDEPRPTVVQAIDAFDPRPRLTDLPLRLPVHDVGGRGAAGPGSGGVVVGGKVECGALAPGTRVAVVPGGSGGTGGGGGSSSGNNNNKRGAPGPPILVVKSLEVGGAPAAVARAGDNVDVVLVPAPGGGGGGGASSSSASPATAEAAARLLFPGAVLCHPDFPAPAASRVTLRLLLLPDLKVPLLRGAAVTLHAHTAREAARVSALVALLDARTGAVVKERPRFLTAGQAGLVRVELARPVALEPQEGALRALGRVALRLGSATAAVGVVASVDDDADGDGDRGGE